MKIDIKHCIQWAKEAEGIAVVMDVFRASNTIIACLAWGAEYLIPVGTLDDAFALKKKFPDHILFGEREGQKVEGCEYGNSPVEASQLSLNGKKIILTTSAWSQGVVNANKADEILIGSFANADAIVKYIQKKNPTQVSLIAIGFISEEIAEEDELCWQYIQAKLSGEDVGFSSLKDEMLKCQWADRLRWLGQKDDLAFCLQLDTYDIVPVYDRRTWRITHK